MSEQEKLVVNPSAAFHPLPSSPPIPEISYLLGGLLGRNEVDLPTAAHAGVSAAGFVVHQLQPKEGELRAPLTFPPWLQELGQDLLRAAAQRLLERFFK